MIIGSTWYRKTLGDAKMLKKAFASRKAEASRKHPVNKRFRSRTAANGRNDKATPINAMFINRCNVGNGAIRFACIVAEYTFTLFDR